MAAREYVIGRYRLQPGRGLRADGVPVPLSLKALDIFAALVEAAGELVTKSELMDRVWPGVVVEEHNIQVHVSALRKALGDEADWIVTAPRLGYRFAGPVTVAAPDPPPAPARPLGRLFGRTDDLAAVEALFDRVQLVTLAGPGGIGKTRLGRELLHALGGHYRDGTVLVDLSLVQDPALVESHVAAALGIELRGDAPAAALLARRLKPRAALVLFDNCEHVLDAVAPLVELILAEAPEIDLLTTSREPLACLGEQVYRLPLLPVPGGGVRSAAEALRSSAVALLVDRLQAADLRFELTDATAAAAVAICRRLDGLPLAIEMVGALAPGLGLAEVAARLEASFELPYSVSRTAPPRHRSLEATLDWSHALLSPAERVLLRRLAVFPGPFSLAAVEAIVGDAASTAAPCGDALAGLVRKSMVSIDPAAALSYRLLETIRTYAAEKLEAAGERERLHARHAHHVADVLGRAMRDWDGTADAVWVDRYGWLLADLRAALRWSFGLGGDRATGLAIASRSRQLWQQLNLRAEGRRWAEAATATLGPDTPDELAAPLWLAVGFLMGDFSFERAAVALRQAAALYGRLNDWIHRGTALAWLGQVLALTGDTAAAADPLAEARTLLARDAGSRRLGICAMGYGMLHTALGSWSEARREYEAARTLFQAAGAMRLAMAALYNLADALWTEGALGMAIATKREALELAQRQGNWDLVGLAYGSLAGMLTARGDLDEALVAARAAVPLCREAEYLDWLFPHLALRAAKAGRPEDAARLWGYADRAGAATVRQTNERRAIEALSTHLTATLSPTRLEELRMAGRHLGDEEVIALALA